MSSFKFSLRGGGHSVRDNWGAYRATIKAVTDQREGKIFFSSFPGIFTPVSRKNPLNRFNKAISFIAKADQKRKIHTVGCMNKKGGTKVGKRESGSG